MGLVVPGTVGDRGRVEPVTPAFIPGRSIPRESMIPQFYRMGDSRSRVVP
jgi:hypothetical protein